MTRIVRFREGLDDDGTVLLDVSPGVAGLQLGEGFAAPPPPLQRAVSQAVTADGGVVGPVSYGLRTVTLPLVLPSNVAGDVRARQTAITGLMRVLARERFTLEVQTDNSGGQSRFLACYAAADPQIVADLEGTSASAVVTILADPFAFRRPNTFATITGGTNGTDARFRYSFALPDTRLEDNAGDVPAPGSILVTTFGEARGTMVLGSRSGPMTHETAVPVDAQAWTGAPGLTADTSAVDDNYKRVTVATLAAFAECTDFAGIGLRSGLSALDRRWLPGQYRVFLRCRTTNSLDRWSVLLRMGIARQNYEVSPQRPLGTAVLSGANGTDWQYLDLGLVTAPYGQDGTQVMREGVQPMDDLSMSLKVTRDHATGTGGNVFDVDALVVIPADEGLVLSTFDSGAANYPGSGDSSPFLRSIGYDAEQGRAVMGIAGGVLGRDLAGSANDRVISEEVQASYLGGPLVVRPGSEFHTVGFLTISGTQVNGVDVLAVPRYLTVV